MLLLRAVTLSLLLVAVAISVSAPVAATAATIQDPGRGETPVSIRIPQVLVDTGIEPREIQGGVPQSSSGSWVVTWYKETGRLGVPGNAVMTGLFDTADGSASVFYFLDQLTPNDHVELAGRDGERYTYRVDWVESYPIESAPLNEIFADEAESELLTLFTGDGVYNQETGTYANVFVARASREAGPASPGLERAPSTYNVPDGCPVAPATLDLPAATAPLPTRSALDLPAAQAASDETVAELDAVLAEVADCDVATRGTLLLTDGTVLALVGPAGDLPLEVLQFVVDDDFVPVFDTLADLCAFMLFIEEDGEWRTVQIPFLSE